MFPASFAPFKYTDSEENWESTWQLQKQNENNPKYKFYLLQYYQLTGGYFQKRTVQLQLPVYLFSFLSGIYQEYRVFIITAYSDQFFKSLTSRKTL